MNSHKSRCTWAQHDPLLRDYHDHEWGVPIFDDRLLFEFLILEGAQAGLNWLTVLKKRADYRRCFDNFEFKKIANYSAVKMRKLLSNPTIIRNRLKIHSVVTNARACLEIKKEWQQFSNYLWHFVDGIPVQHAWKDCKSVPPNNALSDQLSKDLKKRGFKFVGSTICYAFMQAVGMINDHTIDCFRYKKLSSSRLKRRDDGVVGKD